MIIKGICSQKLTAFSSIEHCFFDRNGGESSGDYKSMNCSNYVGDKVDQVTKNLENAKTHLNSDHLVILKQNHGNVCHKISQKNIFEIKEGDALVSDIPGIAIGVLTADCAPILFYDFRKNIVAAAHAGWKGSFSGIIESTLNSMCDMGASVSNIIAVVGPCIGIDSYEIDKKFMEKFHGNGKCFKIKNGKMHFDLSKYCKIKLLQCNILDENIELINVDTYQNPMNYFSYRYASKNSNGICGRQLSAISINLK